MPDSKAGGGIVPSNTTPNATASRPNFIGAYCFKIGIDQDTAALFSECSGLEMSVKCEEVREGGMNEFVHKLPGPVEYGNLVLKRGFLVSNELFTWCLSVLNRTTIQRKSVTVTLFNTDDGSAVYAWTFKDAYPVKWSGPAFKADANTVSVETLELAHRGLQVA